MINIIAGGLMSALEKELLNHEPEIQQFILSELSSLAQLLIAKLEAKIASRVQGATNG